MRSFLLFVLIATASEGLAAEHSEKFLKCQAMLDKKAAKHVRQTNSISDRFLEKVDKRVVSFVSSLPQGDTRTGSTAGVISRLVEREQFEYYRNYYVDKLVQDVTTRKEEEGKPFQCPMTGDVVRYFAQSRRNYTKQLGDILEAVDDRIDVESLGPDEGLAVITFYPRGNIDGVYINRLDALGGGIRFGPVKRDEYFRVIKVKAGNYKWQRLWRKTYFGRSVFHIGDRDLGFTIEAGKLNFTGLFLFRDGALGYATLDVRNRTSAVLTLLEQHYPELLDAHDLVNGFAPDDKFIDYYLGEKRASAPQKAAEKDDEA